MLKEVQTKFCKVVGFSHVSNIEYPGSERMRLIISPMSDGMNAKPWAVMFGDEKTEGLKIVPITANMPNPKENWEQVLQIVRNIHDYLRDNYLIK